MADIITVFRVEHPDIALTRTAGHDPTATIRPIRQAGTDPEGERYLFSVTSEDFDRFEAGLAADPTVDEYERVLQLDDEVIYAFVYSPEAVLFSTQVGKSNGVVLDIENEGTAWILKAWFPDRESARTLWGYAQDNDIEIRLERINDYGSIGSSEYNLTESQREALLVAFHAGYFEDPRAATLRDVAQELDISGPAASGLLRRALERLIRSTVVESDSP